MARKRETVKDFLLQQGHRALHNPPWQRMDTKDRLLHACLMAYAKHNMDSPHLTWEALGDVLQDAICEAVGDDNFVAWGKSIRSEADQSDVED